VVPRPLRPGSDAARGEAATPAAPGSAWAELGDETGPMPLAPSPGATAAPEQMSLFVFEDAPSPRPSRLRRLRKLLAALETQRHGLEQIAALGTKRKRAPTGEPTAAPTPLWPDSFFD